MEKLIKMMTLAIGLVALPPTERDSDKLGKSLKDIEDFLSSDEARDLQSGAEWKTMADQLRKDVDDQAKAVLEMRRNGLGLSGVRAIMPAGRRERLEMLADGKCFMDDDTAKRFGAHMAVKLWKANARDVNDLPVYTRELAESVAKAADIDPTVTGGGAELVADEFKAELIRNVEAVGKLYTLMRRVPLTTFGTTTYPKRTGGLTAFPTAVAAQIQQSGIQFGTVQLKPEKWGTLTAVPNEMFRFPSMLAAVGQLVGLEIVYAMSYAFDNAVANGDGTADYGGITGILQSANISAVTAAAGHTTMATIDETDISNVIAGLTADYAIDAAAWGFSLSVQRAMRNIRTTTGQPMYDRGDAKEPNTIDGYPYHMSNRMPAKASVTAGVKYSFFGDLQKSHYFGMVGAIEIAQSDHVLFASDMTVIRGIAHVDCKEADVTAIVIGKTAAA